MTTAPPGWYADPGAAYDPTLPADALRWWDGSAWTEHTHAPTPPDAPARLAASGTAFAPVLVAPGSAAAPASVTAETSVTPETAVTVATAERNPFSRYALIFGIATIAAAALVAVNPLAGLVAVITGVLALLFGILGIVRSVRTRTGRASSVWGTVLGPAGVILAGIVWIVAFIALTPNLGFPGMDYPQPLAEAAERQIMRELETAATADPSVPYPDTVECPDTDEVQFLCTIRFVDGSTNVAVVSQTPSGLLWQPAELGEVGEK
ncbi:hypothetical protein ASF62_08235 [Leifsonia sp. Leaf325]|nr:DUF2510 domain-containing protein [Leifsonia sp. Leaf325]KQQ94125.1 hypothetical protein ASF62_08235 [Leifsonia sp. Leaf325]